MAGFQLQIQITGLDKILEKFNGKLPTELRDAFKEQITQSYVTIMSQLATYPAATGTYQRTDALGQGWENAKPTYAGSNGLSILATYTNPVEYVSYVQGTPQAWMHAGRWKSADQIAKDNTPLLEQNLNNAAQSYLDGALGNGI